MTNDTGKTLTRDDVELLSTDVPGQHRGQWWHIRIAGKYYVVSAVDLGISIANYRSSETMAFPADESGEVTDWGELAMVPHKDHWDCIDDLLESLGGAE